MSVTELWGGLRPGQPLAHHGAAERWPEGQERDGGGAEAGHDESERNRDFANSAQESPYLWGRKSSPRCAAPHQARIAALMQHGNYMHAITPQDVKHDVRKPPQKGAPCIAVNGA